MDSTQLEKLGLNRNEARVYLALLGRGEATAQELIKALGVHRNIVYDNIEKLAEKGLVSFMTDGPKRKFVAEKPAAVMEYLKNKRKMIDIEINDARKLLPEITKILGTTSSKQEVTLFKGIAGLKKILLEIVQSKQSWCIGITNESVKILGETFWKNYNLKKKQYKTEEWLLWNHDYKDTVILKNKKVHNRILQKEIEQVTETIMWNNKVGVFVYSQEPLVIVMENREIFRMYRSHFEFLWKLSKEPNKPAGFNR